MGSKRDGMLGLPLGRPSVVKEVVGKPMTIKREKPASEYKRFRHDIEFTGKLWPNQRKPVATIIKKKRGVLLSPPRSGKTVMAIAAAIKIGYRTLIMAAQIDWLRQFVRSMKGPDSVTNIDSLEKFNGRRIVGIVTDVKDMLKYDIVLCTYQTFLSAGGKEKLKQIQDHFGTIIIDECFTYGHRVKTKSGLMSLGDIVESGYKTTVECFNHQSGKREFKPIESFTKKAVTHLVRITIDGRELLCTPNHKFWSVTRQGYVKASELTADDELLLSK
jgi:thymidine kinase